MQIGRNEVSAMLSDNPELAVEQVISNSASEDRQMARASQRAAGDERDHQYQQQAEETRNAANVKLASGLIGGISQIGQGLATMGSASTQIRQNVEEHASNRLRDRQDAILDRANRGTGQAVVTADQLGGADGEQYRRLGQEVRVHEESGHASQAQSTRLDAVSKLTAGGAACATSVLDRLSSELESSATQHQRAAERARDRSDESRQDANASSERINHSQQRAEAAIQGEGQVRGQVIGNIRA